MTIEQTLLARCDSKCELCASESPLSIYDVPPVTDASAEQSVMLCVTCKSQGPLPIPVDRPHIVTIYSADFSKHFWYCR